MDRYEELTYMPPEMEKVLGLVVTDLERLIALTEEKYGYIYENLPVIEQDVNLSIREVEILLRHLIADARSSTGTHESVTINTINGIMSGLDAVTSTFLNEELVMVLQRTFLDKSGDERLSFHELVRVVQEVEDVLATLRDLALNSIIFAIRIGDEGAGFQILSDRINQVSLELGRRFGDMKETINRLNKWNKEFQQKLAEFVEYEEELKHRYQNRFQTSFQHVVSALTVICGILENNLGYTKDALSGVSRIMVMVQNQDIIRQNIENMSKCFKIMLDKKESVVSGSMEECLDYLTFADRVLNLSKTLVGNIENSLNESIFSLSGELAEMDVNVTDLEEDSLCLTELFAGNENRPDAECVIKNVFDTVSEQLDDLMSIEKNIEVKSGLLFAGIKTFTELMETVEQYFADIDRETRNLRKMKVLIKIELARIDVGSDLSLDTIGSAVDEVVETIHTNQQMFMKLRSHFEKNMEAFNRAVNRTSSKLGGSTDTLDTAKTKLVTIKGLAAGAVVASNREMKEIFKQLRLPGRNLADTGLVGMLLTDVNTRINEVHETVQRAQKDLLMKNGITQWEEKGEDLKLLMDQFTCFVERKAMKDLTGGTVQDIGSSSGGDIVLF